MFFGDDDTITTVEPADITFLVVLGEVGIAEAARVLDAMHGGYAMIACNRLQEVA